MPSNLKSAQASAVRSLQLEIRQEALDADKIGFLVNVLEVLPRDFDVVEL